MDNTLFCGSGIKHSSDSGISHKVACSREGIHGLPVDLLAEVLQHVEQTERLGCCSLVCKIWQQAAKLATSKVEFTFDAEQGLGSLTAWLKSNKFLNKLTSIIIGDDTAHDPALPVPSLELDCVQLEQLTSLELCGCHVKAVTATDESHAHSAAVMTSAAETALPYAAAAGTAGRTPVTASNLKSLGALTALNSLDLLDTCLDLDELSCCTGLQWLGMCNVRHITTEPAEDTAPDFRVQASPTLCPTPQIACALPALMQLTHLNISHKYCQDDEEQQQLASIICASIGNLRQLRSLRLGLKSITADHLAHLPNRLTALYIADAPQLTFAKTPQLARMTGLRELGVIGSPSIDALLLSTVTQLTRLVIVTSDRSPVAEDELLTALQQLQLLKSLQLPGCFEQDSPMLDLYAALTISCELEELDLRNCIIPPNAFPFMFPPSRVRQHLTTVHITSDLLGSIDNCEYLIGCCPALVEFRMKDLRLLPARAGLVDVQGLSAFSRLTALETFSITDVALNNDALTGITACSQIQDLTLIIKDDPDTHITLGGLLHLAQLTRLTSLLVRAVIDNMDIEVDLERMKKLVAATQEFDVA